MNRNRLTLVLLSMALFPALASAQPVFFDDFDGDELLPHWNVPPDDHWEYEVNGGMLHVTDLLYPSDNHFGGNYADMIAGFDVQRDFRADVWMGWDAGDEPHRLMFHVLGSRNEFIASFGYHFEEAFGPDPLISASTGGGDVLRALAPDPGVYRFGIERAGSSLRFIFGGQSFASFSDRFGTPASKVYLELLGPYPGQFGTLHIDRVRVVPPPGLPTMFLVAGFSWWHRAGRRRLCVREMRSKGGLI